MVFDMLNDDGGGGGGVGDGVCCGGEGEGGMDGIHRKPCLINWTTLCSESCAAPSSSLT